MSAPPLASRRLFLGMAAAVPLAMTGALTIGSRSASASTGCPFVMGYFTRSPRGLGTDYRLHLPVSTDALQWMPLNQNNPVVTPPGRRRWSARPVHPAQSGRHLRRHGDQS